ncbi:Cse1-domain-containing protein [Clavulina sp. PMI_390]|nr:Cse1-domain-containing protein [Clavulina sp. PMI_390]
MSSPVPALLAQSLVIDQRKNAEAQLSSMAVTAGFVPHLLQIVLDRSQDIPVRQAACVYFKNQIKQRWDDEDSPIPDADKITVRQNLVGSMVSLSQPTDKLLRSQVGEAVATVAKHDFPDAWPDLVSNLVGTLTPSDYTTNLSVLQTAHNIFAPWKSEIRSDNLYKTINLALSQFVEPYFALFRATGTLLTSADAAGMNAATLGLLGDVMDLLFSLYYDMTAQDLPPAFEDAHEEFFGSETQEGWFVKFLQWNPPQLEGDPDDPTPTAPLRIKTTVLEICELYTQRYNELSAPRLPIFVQGVWQLIGASSPAVREDGMVAQAIRFLSVSAKTGSHVELFKQEATLRALCEHIVVPSMGLREHEEEQFEDDPLEYIRRDLALSIDPTSGSTRRHAASELVRALLSISTEVESTTTTIVQSLITSALSSYAANPQENWKHKDTALALFTAVASLGSTSAMGVTSTNANVDVVAFFGQNVYGDLTAQQGVHAILQVDAIRFIYQFRYQLTKEQLLTVLPNLMQHLASENYVSYTYAAITIERILFIKRGSAMLFSQADIHETAAPMLRALFAKIHKEKTPQKIAENEYLMKCIMRVVLTARQTLIPIFQDVLTNLVGILNEISKNPSNPTFDQYCFESIAALLRFTVTGNATTLSAFENILFESVRTVLQQDIDQYVPYVLQIVAQMLEMHATGESIPPIYASLFPLLITPVVWQQKGSIPPLVRLIKAYLSKDSATIVASGTQIPQILGVVQQRLIPSKLNDNYGFDVLEALATYIPQEELGKHWKAVLLMLMNRLQTTKTEKYQGLFVRFLCFMMALEKPALLPSFTVRAVEEIQPGLWVNVVTGIIVPQMPHFRQRDRRLVGAGVTRLLLSEEMLVAPQINTWSVQISFFAGVSISEPANANVAADADVLSAIDHEEQTAGYQAAYARLAASETTTADPVAYVGTDVVAWMKAQLSEAATRDSRVQQQLSVVGRQTPLLTKILG